MREAYAHILSVFIVNIMSIIKTKKHMGTFQSICENNCNRKFMCGPKKVISL